MPKLTGTTIVVNPATYLSEVLLAGSDLPEWAAGLVGNHLLDEPELAVEPAPVEPEPVADAADATPAEVEGPDGTPILPGPDGIPVLPVELAVEPAPAEPVKAPRAPRGSKNN